MIPWWYFLWLWSVWHQPAMQPRYYAPPPPPIIHQQPLRAPTPTVAPYAPPTCYWIATDGVGVEPRSRCFVIQPPCLPLAPVCA